MNQREFASFDLDKSHFMYKLFNVENEKPLKSRTR